jgi:hypothetical protein
LRVTWQAAIALKEHRDCVLDVGIASTPCTDVASFVLVFRFAAPRRRLRSRWIDDHSKAVPGVGSKRGFDLRPRDLLRIALDVDAWLGGVWRIESKDQVATGAAQRFKELVYESPVN